MAAAHSRVLYTFGDFRFDPVAGTLERCHRGVPLARQPALVLELLLANAGQLVLREEMIATVWGDGTTVVYADGLNFCMRQIRLALGESARDPVLIETFPKRGYRFAGRVSRISHATVVSPQAGWFKIAALAAFVIIGALGAPATVPSAPPASARTAAGSVTPFISATLRQADMVVQMTLGSIEAHLAGGDCPWPRYWSARRRSA